MSSLWRPTAAIENLRQRADMLSQVRAFFLQRHVLEVTTPVLGQAGVTDPHIDNFSTQYSYASTGSPQPLYLQSSPEYAMKRLLAAGSGSIYQIAPAFRHEGHGRYHNPEFTMLEWYRVGFAMQDLIDEMAALLKTTLCVESVSQCTYQALFEQYLNINPLETSQETLIQTMKAHHIDWVGDKASLTTDDALQLLFAHVIEPKIGIDVPVVVTHFPASQAALAKIDDADPRTAKRFEVYFHEVELANGFEELTDAQEQARRFDQDNALRDSLGKSRQSIDSKFLQALEAGLPACSGVALGIERLLMLKLGAENIQQVMAFPIERA